MTIRPTTTIGIQPNTRLLRIERIERDVRGDAPDPFVNAAEQVVLQGLVDRGLADVDAQRALCGAWMIWINANINFTLGTYIKLNDDGSIERVTVETDGTEDVFVIKKKEG